ncbi:MAG: hypothetical protein JW723_03295 [Bacteroidales bacterium]|nr:hypothetical protein [Bacteroidales bacterium]
MEYTDPVFSFKMENLSVITDYHKYCAAMTPVERLKKSYELGEWSKKMNRHYHLEIEKRLKGTYLLK